MKGGWIEGGTEWNGGLDRGRLLRGGTRGQGHGRAREGGQGKQCIWSAGGITGMLEPLVGGGRWYLRSGGSVVGGDPEEVG